MVKGGKDVCKTEGDSPSSDNRHPDLDNTSVLSSWAYDIKILVTHPQLWGSQQILLLRVNSVNISINRNFCKK